MASDGSVIIDTRMDTSGFSHGAANMKKSFSGLSSSLKKIGLMIGSVFAVKQLVSFGKEAIELGSDLAEVQNVVDSVFTTMNEKVNEFAKSAAQSFGLSETMAKQYAGNFGAMAKSFGFAEDAALEMSTTLTGLAGDVASFYNISQDEAYTKLKSVFTGETESLKELGIVMTQTALDSYAMKTGIGKTTSAMTEQEKVALRYKFVLDQLSTASGDFLRTSDGWANQVRVLKLQIDSLKATIGQGLINIFTPIIQVINQLLSKLATVANAFKAFTELITGKKSQAGTSTGVKSDSIAQVGNDYNQAADGANNLADSTEKAADATKKAAKAAEGYLSPIDEINKIGAEDNLADAITPDGTTGGLADQIQSAVGDVDYGKLAEGETVLDKTSSSLDKLVENLKKFKKVFDDAWSKEGLNTINSMKYALQEIGALLSSMGGSVFDVWTNGTGVKTLTLMLKIFQNMLNTVGNIVSRLNAAWNTFGIGTAIVQNLFNIFNNVLSTIEGITRATAEWAAKLDFTPLLTSINVLLIAIEPLTENIGSGLEWFYKNVLLPIAGWTIQEAIPTFLNMLSAALNVVNQVIVALQPLAIWLFESFLQPLGQWTGELVITAMTKITELLNSFATWISEHQELVQNFVLVIGAFALAWEVVSTVMTIWQGVATVATTVTNALAIAIKFLTSPVGIVTVAIGALIAVGVLLYKNWDTIMEWAGKLKDWLIEKTTEMKETVVKGFETLRDNIFDAAKAIYEFLKQTWQNIKTTAGNIWGLIKTTIVTIFNSIKLSALSIWNNIKEAISGIWDGLSSSASTMFGKIEKAINGVWESIQDTAGKSWNWISEKVIGVGETVRDTVTEAFNALKTNVSGAFEGLVNLIKTPINSVISLINNMINTINGAIRNIENAFSFSYDFKNPITGTRHRGHYGLDLPEVPTIPYLAKGAVIPPNAPYMAMVGDQRHGTNIEAPLETIKQAIRDVVGDSSSGSTYRIPVNISGRQLMEIIIDEAQLKRARNGKNPFALGGV